MILIIVVAVLGSVVLAKVKTLKSRIRPLPKRVANISSARKRLSYRARNRLRVEVLQDEPFCRKCASKAEQTVATQVDHIVPLVQGGTEDRSNLQPLCDDCHEEKTSAEQTERYLY